MSFSFSLCGFPLSFRLDGFHGVYAAVALFMWAISLLFSPRYFRGHHHRARYYFFTVLTLLATVGVFLSDHLYATFIFFEIMSFASYPWVAQEETPDALRAASTYLAVTVFGGMVTLMGLFWLYRLSGTLSFDGLRDWAASCDNPSALYGPAALALTGFAAKAGVFPLHIWLPKAHPVAPAPASALLSGVLTKTGVFGMVVLSVNLFPGDAGWGNALLLLAGMTMVLGALMAVFSTDLKHTLACSSMSQIGFILTGLSFSVLLGPENALAARGTFLHMLNHSLIKLDLFLCAGAIYMNTHTLNLTALRGYGRHKPLLHFCFLMGYLGIIGMPLFNGYLSKSLIHEGILAYVEENTHLGGNPFWYSLYEKIFLFSGGLTAAYMTKLYLCLFWFRNRDAARQQAWDDQTRILSPTSAAALVLSAAVLPVLGMLPNRTAGPLADSAMPFFGGAALTHAISWFSVENLLGAAISLLIGGVVCWLIHRLLIRKGEYINRWPAWLNLEEAVYAPLVNRVLPAIGTFLASAADHLLDQPLVWTWIPRAVTTLTQGLDNILSNRVMLSWIPRAVTALTRGLEKCTDFAALAMRHTLFRPQKIADANLTLSEKTDLVVGQALNRVDAKHDHISRLSSVRREADKANRYLIFSVSFGLLMLAFGLCAMLIYLLFIRI